MKTKPVNGSNTTSNNTVIWEDHMMVQGHIGGRINVDDNDSGAVATPAAPDLTHHLQQTQAYWRMPQSGAASKNLALWQETSVAKVV